MILFEFALIRIGSHERVFCFRWTSRSFAVAFESPLFAELHCLRWRIAQHLPFAFGGLSWAQGRSGCPFRHEVWRQYHGPERQDSSGLGRQSGPRRLRGNSRWLRSSARPGSTRFPANSAAPVGGSWPRHVSPATSSYVIVQLTTFVFSVH